jgi:hypothetical protein
MRQFLAKILAISLNQYAPSFPDVHSPTDWLRIDVEFSVGKPNWSSG